MGTCFRKSLQSVRMCSSLSLLLVPWWPKSHIRARRMTWVRWRTKQENKRHPGRFESLMWQHFSFQWFLIVFFCLFFYSLTGEGPWETRCCLSVLTSIQRRSVLYEYYFFKEKRSYEVHKREHLKKWLRRGLTMPSLCCDLGSSCCSEQRNGKDYPQECLGCPQTQCFSWPANGRARPSGGLIFSWWTQPPAS